MKKIIRKKKMYENKLKINKNTKNIKKLYCSHCRKLYESTTLTSNVFKCFDGFKNHLKNLNFAEFCASDLGYGGFFKVDKQYTKLLADACIDSYYEILNSQTEGDNITDKKQIIEKILSTGIVDELTETATDSLVHWLAKNDDYTFIIQYVDWDKLFDDTAKKLRILIAKFLNKAIDYVRE